MAYLSNKEIIKKAAASSSDVDNILPPLDDLNYRLVQNVKKNLDASPRERDILKDPSHPNYNMTMGKHETRVSQDRRLFERFPPTNQTPSGGKRKSRKSRSHKKRGGSKKSRSHKKRSHTRKSRSHKKRSHTRKH